MLFRSDAKVKIQIMNDTSEEYEELKTEITDNEIDDIIDNEIEENYLE